MAGVKGMKGGGGARVGAGRKRRDPTASWLAGDRRQKPTPRVPAGEGTVACPAYVDDEARRVWAEGIFCAYIVLERKLRAAPLACAGPDHRGMIARVEAGRVRFRLIADGKAIDTTPMVDEWAEFDSPLTVVRGGKGHG